MWKTLQYVVMHTWAQPLWRSPLAYLLASGANSLEVVSSKLNQPIYIDSRDSRDGWGGDAPHKGPWRAQDPPPRSDPAGEGKQGGGGGPQNRGPAARVPLSVCNLFELCFLKRLL